MGMILDLAEEVLRKAPAPLSYMEIWNAAKNDGLPDRMGITGKTPANTISSRLGSDVEKVNSRFLRIQTVPRRFFLKSRRGELSPEDLEKVREPEPHAIVDLKPVEGFREKDLHSLLAYFVHRSPEFWGERKIYTKTIAHQKSKHGPINGRTKKKWQYPDMVGVYLPFGDMPDTVIDLNQKVGLNSLVRFFSFELKKDLKASDCRDKFVQAVFNSSWAHEGYLVAADIDGKDIELNRELNHLTNSFGIGIINLDREDIDASKVLYPAKLHESMDWDTVNKLYSNNKDFRKFLDGVRGDIMSGIIYPQQYDSIPDPE